MHESPTKVHASQAGGGSARMSFPRFPARRRTVEVTLLEGQTVGELMCQYTGEFTEENINTVAQLNKNLKDLDFVRPGTVIRLVDNRAPKLATPEAEWWSAREWARPRRRGARRRSTRRRYSVRKKTFRRRRRRAARMAPSFSATKKTSPPRLRSRRSLP